MQITLPAGVFAVTKPNGRVYHYFRLTKPHTSLPGAPGSPEFERALRMARASLGTAGAGDAPIEYTKEGTLGRIIERFMKSVAHLGLPGEPLPLASRSEREYYLARIAAKWGERRIEEFDARGIRDDIATWHDEMAEKPASADKHIAVLSRLLSWAVGRGLIDVNRAIGIEHFRKTGTRASIIVSAAIEAQLIAKVSPEFGRVIRFARLTAIRRGDICRLAGANWDGRWITFAQMKTGIQVALPVYELPELAALMREIEHNGDPAAPLFRTVRGLPWEGANIIARWRRALREYLPPPVPNLHFHDLRGTAIQALQRAGCNPFEVASISGHTMHAALVSSGCGAGAALSSYTGRDSELAINAYRKLADYHRRSGDANVVAFPRRA